MENLRIGTSFTRGEGEDTLTTQASNDFVDINFDFEINS